MIRYNLIFLGLCVSAFSKTYNSNGSTADINAKIAHCKDDYSDTVTIPDGSFTVGAGGTHIDINKRITFKGLGSSSTLVMSPSGPPGSAGVIRITAAAIVRDFATVPASNVAVFSIYASGARITNITHNRAYSSATGYFAFYNNVYGLIDNCSITGASGRDELIFARGPSNSWATPHTLGGANNVFVEDCHFNGPGYICDANSNARFVIRRCVISGGLKADGHGKASNTPPRGVRHMEIYQNTWTYNGGYYTAIELRGGGGIVWGNTNTSVAGYGALYLTDYGYLGLYFGGVYQTPTNYPIDDQIGVGMGRKAAGSEPMYLFSNTLNGSPWPRFYKTPAPAAIKLYRSQTGNPSASFGDANLIAANRDFFVDDASYGAVGVTVGVHAARLAMSTGSLPVGYGFWETDTGEWDSTNGGTPDGRMYKWSGSAWALSYTPYTYPHPLRAER